MITYDKNGTIDAKIAKGEYKEDQSIELRKVIGNMDDSKYDNIFSRLENEHDLERPKNRTYIYAMTEENIDKYMDNEYYSGFYTPGEAVSLITILMACLLYTSRIMLKFLLVEYLPVMKSALLYTDINTTYLLHTV